MLIREKQKELQVNSCTPMPKVQGTGDLWNRLIVPGFPNLKDINRTKFAFSLPIIRI